MGWSFQSNKKEIIFVAVAMIAAFWVLDAVNKNFREDYKKRRDEVSSILRHLFKHKKTPASAISPSLPSHRWGEALKKIFEPHVFIVYLALFAVSVVLFLVL